MKQLQNLLLLFIFIASSMLVTAQSNCANYVRYHSPTHPYKYSSLSKSATCVTGKNYKFVIPLSEGKNYQFAFYASTIFNNRIEFKLTDQSSGQDILFLPGAKTQFDDQTSYFNEVNEFAEVLVKGVDDATYQSLPYPSFEIEPATAINLQVEINILESEKGGQKRGCVGVFVQDKVIKTSAGFDDGFN